MKGAGGRDTQSWISFVLALSLLALIACNGSVDHEVDSEIQSLVHQTSSGDLSSSNAQPQVLRNRAGVDADWRITTTLPIGDYLDAVKKRLSSNYQVVQQSPVDLGLRRLLPGDSYELHLVGSVTQERQTTIAIHFSARPD